MNKRRKYPIIIFACIIALLAGCNNESKVKRIAIAQYIDHPMLDECRKGFMRGMEDLGYIPDKNIKYDYQNAQGDMNLNYNIAEKFGKGNYDVIFSIATPTSQALKKTTSNTQIPVVFGAITDPVSAGLVKSLESSGNNFTGTSDQWPYYNQLKLITEILPKAKTIGIIYNSGEANTEFAMKQTRMAADSLDLILKESPITNTNEVALGANVLINKVDAIYITADNTTMAAAPVIIKIANENNIPVFAGDPGTFDAGCIAGIGVSYYNLGLANAKMVDMILKNEKKPSQIPVVISDKPELMLNMAVAKKLGINIPEYIVKKADKVVK